MMRRVSFLPQFVAGFVLGLALGAAAGVSAAQIIGSSGYLIGWTVEKEGEEVRSNPYVWTATREIECD